MKLRLLRSVMVLAVVTLVASPAFALSLPEAKASGAVGETPTGYLAATSDKPAPAVSALVADINSKRKTEYQKIANTNGTPLAQVERLAGMKAVEKSAPGHFVLSDSGSWERK